jgi:hypothetical protein
MCSVHHAKNRRDLALGKRDRKILTSGSRSREDLRQYLTAYGEY